MTRIASAALTALGLLGLLLSSAIGCSGSGARGAAPPPAVVDVAPTAPTAPAASGLSETPSTPVAGGPRTREDDGGALEARSARVNEVAEARRLFSEGRECFGRGDYPQALERFEAANRLAPAPALLYDIGRTLELLGRRRDAADAYERYLQTGLSHTDRSSMELRIKLLRSAAP